MEWKKQKIMAEKLNTPRTNGTTSGLYSYSIFSSLCSDVYDKSFLGSIFFMVMAITLEENFSSVLDH